eukprot:TRINITY_DN4159_c0_g1_i14.p9 TRINITY_DN4159_c0_g1~~TRINITY_DN4159_c0_g1_i14.p9  ORF type:complete len:112 (-),score=4.93 TRINITY_DN4159_c0_g1_i14:1862-2197(-)
MKSASGNIVETVQESQTQLLQIVYNQYQGQDFAPIYDKVVGDTVILEVPLINFGMQQDYCNEDALQCSFYERGFRYLWNNDTQQCDGMMTCKTIGFDLLENCQLLAPNFCM